MRFALLWGGLAVGLSVLSCIGLRAAPPPQYLPLEAQWCLKSGTCLLLEVADKAEEQRLGLMQRHALPSGQGMWFPFQPARRLRFWMHNTLAALDMVFVDQGRVIAIEAAVPVCPHLPCPSYGPKLPADGVVELAAGRQQGYPSRLVMLCRFNLCGSLLIGSLKASCL